MKIFTIAPENKFILKAIFLFYQEIVCCEYSLELSHQDNSNKYTHHTIIGKRLLNYRHLLPDPD